MRKCSHRVYLTGILFFCCILLYTGTNFRASLKSGRMMCRMEANGGEQEEEEEEGFFAEWRYVRIYRDEASYLVLDLLDILGILMLFAVFAVAGKEGI